MPVEDNKQAARRFYQEVINGRNLDAMDELLTSDGVDHTFGSQNAEQAKQFFGLVQQAFPDLHAEVHDVIAEGDLVAARVTLWVPDIRSPHATCAYSWISPPSRSRRTTPRAGRMTDGSAGPSGGAWPRARCGRWPL
jgi:predicted SnoaL-like aldol condensation-catalyzing enzyme